MLRYVCEADADTEKFILEILFYEAISLFGYKLMCEVEKNKLKSLISNHLQKVWNYSCGDALIFVPTPQFGGARKLLKTVANEWFNYVTKGIQIYGKNEMQRAI